MTDHFVFAQRLTPNTDRRVRHATDIFTSVLFHHGNAWMRAYSPFFQAVRQCVTPFKAFLRDVLCILVIQEWEMLGCSLPCVNQRGNKSAFLRPELSKRRLDITCDHCVTVPRILRDCNPEARHATGFLPSYSLFMKRKWIFSHEATSERDKLHPRFEGNLFLLIVFLFVKSVMQERLRYFFPPIRRLWVNKL